MSFPFVSSFHDAGRRSGPILGLAIHMAEGGGTVGFLHRQNRHGVSVHYVIENDGDIVQMLLETHMHTSIRIGANGSALRRTTGSDGFGAKVAVAVLGKWAYIDSTSGPNNATIAVELEGFAAAGPNARQSDALVRLVDDLRTRYPNLGLTGHRDHNVKGCPGPHIPWDRLGGHGAFQGEDPMRTAVFDARAQPGSFTIKAGQEVDGYDPETLEIVKTWKPDPQDSRALYSGVLHRRGNISPSPLLEVSSGFFKGLWIPSSQVVEVPDPVAPTPPPAPTPVKLTPGLYEVPKP